MKATVNTTILQDAVARATKGSSNDKTLILTQLIELKEVDGYLQITTTDFTNYLYIKIKPDSIDTGFQIAVPIEQFAKLVAKTTSTSISMEVVGTDYVKVKANGTYKIPLPLEDEGTPIKFMDKRANIPTDSVWQEWTLSTMKAMISVHKPALPPDGENSIYKDTPYPYYYLGDMVLTTDTNVIVRSILKLTDEKILLSRYFLDLLFCATQEELKVYRNENSLMIDAGNTQIVGYIADGVNDYKVEAIMPLLESEFKAEATFVKDDLLRALDRVSLFIGEYDDTAIQFEFGDGNISLSSKSMTGDEKVKSSNNYTPAFSGKINVNRFATAVKSVVADNVTISYGIESCIKIQEGTVTQIIALEE